MDLFWGSPHLVWLLMVTEWGQRVSPGKKQGGTLGPFIYLSGSKHCLCLTQCAHLMHALFLFTRRKHGQKVTMVDRRDMMNLAFGLFQDMLSIYLTMFMYLKHKERPWFNGPRRKTFWGWGDLNYLLYTQWRMNAPLEESAKKAGFAPSGSNLNCFVSLMRSVFSFQLLEEHLFDLLCSSAGWEQRYERQIDNVNTLMYTVTHQWHLQQKMQPQWTKRFHLHQWRQWGDPGN